MPVVVQLPSPLVHQSLFHPGGLSFLSRALHCLTLRKKESIPALEKHLQQWRQKRNEQEATLDEEMV